MALLTGRDIEAPTLCCGAGEICRAEVRRATRDPDGGEVFAALWRRLIDLGLAEYDYARQLVVPWSSKALVQRGWKSIPRDEETRKALALL